MASDTNKGVCIIRSDQSDLWSDCSDFPSRMVTVTCFTTTAGLIVSTSEFFHSTFPKVSYKVYASVFTLIGFAIANLGLNTIIAFLIACLDDSLPNHHYHCIDCDSE